MARIVLVGLLLCAVFAAASAKVDTTITSKVFFDIDIDGKDAGKRFSHQASISLHPRGFDNCDSITLEFSSTLISRCRYIPPPLSRGSVSHS